MPDLQVDWHSGSRAELRPLFELAEDSPVALNSYLELGRVLVAQVDTTIAGHLQLVPTGEPGEIELKNMAVLAVRPGRGVGRALTSTRQHSPSLTSPTIAAAAISLIRAFR